LQSVMQNLPLNSYITLTKPLGAFSPQPNLTGTLQQLLQALVNKDPSVYDEFDLLIT